MRYLFVPLVCLAFCLSGCAEPTPSDPASPGTAQVAAVEAAAAADATPQGSPTTPAPSPAAHAPPAQPPYPAAAQQPALPSNAAPPTSQIPTDPANPYVGGTPGPARSLFAARERLVFQVALPQALNLYQAEHGRFPRSHEEFMRDVIEFNRINLPELPPGQKYVYDPQSGELMVERPAK
jgi:hypothetical protein